MDLTADLGKTQSQPLVGYVCISKSGKTKFPPAPVSVCAALSIKEPNFCAEYYEFPPVFLIFRDMDEILCVGY